jgi:hypothetical protein
MSKKRAAKIANAPGASKKVGSSSLRVEDGATDRKEKGGRDNG